MSTRVETLGTHVAAAPGPVTGWRRLVADCALVSFTSVVCQALATVTSLVLRMLIDPAQMGIWQAVKLLLGYANYANLGISKGATRELVIARGRGDTTRAERGLDLAFTVNTLSSLSYAGVLVAAGVWIARSGGGPLAGVWTVGLVFAGALAVLQRHVTFHVTILRSVQRFGVAARLSVLEAVLTLAVCGLAAWRWGLVGLCAGTATVMVASLAYVGRHRAARLAWAWDLAEIRRLVAIGAPVLLAGTVASLFRSLDKLMILAYLTDREYQLGCYSLALMVTTALYGMGNTLSIVMGPRYGEKFGKSGSRRAVAELAARSAELQAAAMGLLAGLAIVLAPPVLARLLPDYRPGLAPMLWLIPGSVALTVALPGAQYLVAVERERRALWTVLAGTALAAFGNHWALRGGLGLAGVAAATAAGYVGYTVLVLAVSLWPELDVRAKLRLVAMHVLALGPTIGSALLLCHGCQAWDDAWPRLGLRAAVVVLVWAACASLGWHLGDWGRTLRRTKTA